MFKISLSELGEKAYQIRKDLIELIYRAKSGHLDTSLSLVEVWLSIVYSDFFQYDNKRGDWSDRDRVFLSEGHACPLQYMVNADLGYYDTRDIFDSFRKPGSPFQGHTVRSLEHGFENSNGSLSIGLWQAYGNALVTDREVFCICGDGEFQEPAAFGLLMVTHNMKPSGNFNLIINKNNLAQDSEIDLGPVKEVADTYNWHTAVIDGHDIEKLGKAWHNAVAEKDKPSLIICETVKGFGGDPRRAGKLGSHGKPPANDQEYQAYLAGLETWRKQS